MVGNTFIVSFDLFFILNSPKTLKPEFIIGYFVYIRKKYHRENKRCQEYLFIYFLSSKKH